MRNRILKGVAYTLFFLFCLAVFLVWGFPVERIQSLIEREASKALGMKATVSELSMLFPNGVEASAVRLTKEEEDGKPGFGLLATDVSARIGILGIITGSRDISFSAGLLSGTIEGDLRLDENAQEIAAKIQQLDLAKLPLLSDKIGLPVNGKVQGQVELELNPKDFKAARGTIAIAVEKAGLGEGKLQLPVPGFSGGLTVPPINLGKILAELEIGKGRADIKTLQVRSEDVEATVEGNLNLQKRLDQSMANLKVKFKLTDDFLNRNPKFKDLIQMAGLPRGPDGMSTYNIYGNIGHPQFKVAR